MGLRGLAVYSSVVSGHVVKTWSVLWHFDRKVIHCLIGKYWSKVLIRSSQSQITSFLSWLSRWGCVYPKNKSSSIQSTCRCAGYISKGSHTKWLLVLSKCQLFLAAFFCVCFTAKKKNSVVFVLIWMKSGNLGAHCAKSSCTWFIS